MLFHWRRTMPWRLQKFNDVVFSFCYFLIFHIYFNYLFIPIWVQDSFGILEKNTKNIIPVFTVRKFSLAQNYSCGKEQYIALIKPGRHFKKFFSNRYICTYKKKVDENKSSMKDEFIFRQLWKEIAIRHHWIIMDFQRVVAREWKFYN